MNGRRRRGGRVGWGLILITGLTIGGACDRPAPKPSADKAPDEPVATQPATAARPTTQELTSGSYRKIVLPGVPLSVQAPESWKIEAVGPVMFLTGPTPSDQARIQLSHGNINTFKPDQIDMLAAGAKSEVQRNPEQFKKADLRDIGRLKVLERVSLSRPVPIPRLDERGNAMFDAQGNPVTLTMTPARWTLTVFVPQPQGGEFARVELNFIDLTQEQLAADQTMLQRIVDSLTYEAGLAPGMPSNAGV
jgi:hypothetical protein